jgi:hypothetical protein
LFFAVETLYPRVTIVPTICTMFSSTRPVRSSRYIVYLRHATIFVLADASATSMWRPSEGDRCSGRWYEMRMNNRRWGLVLNHSRAMLLASRSTRPTAGWVGQRHSQPAPAKYQVPTELAHARPPACGPGPMPPHPPRTSLPHPPRGAGQRNSSWQREQEEPERKSRGQI